MGQEAVIAGRYAKGLAEHAIGAGEAPRVRHEVNLLADSLEPMSGAAHAPEFAAFFSSPSVSTTDKSIVAGSIADKLGVCETVKSLLGVLVLHDRVRLLPRIARAFGILVGDLAGDFTAVAHTARPLSDDQAARLSLALSGVLGGAVHLRQRIEPELLAGVKVTAGDRTFDGTALGKLERMRNVLAAAAKAGPGVTGKPGSA